MLTRPIQFNFWFSELLRCMSADHSHSLVSSYVGAESCFAFTRVSFYFSGSSIFDSCAVICCVEHDISFPRQLKLASGSKRFKVGKHHVLTGKQKSIGARQGDFAHCPEFCLVGLQMQGLDQRNQHSSSLVRVVCPIRSRHIENVNFSSIARSVQDHHMHRRRVFCCYKPHRHSASRPNKISKSFFLLTSESQQNLFPRNLQTRNTMEMQSQKVCFCKKKKKTK
jgi:hypothetical protein